MFTLEAHSLTAKTPWCRDSTMIDTTKASTVYSNLLLFNHHTLWKCFAYGLQSYDFPYPCLPRAPHDDGHGPFTCVPTFFSMRAFEHTTPSKVTPLESSNYTTLNPPSPQPIPINNHLIDKRTPTSSMQS